MVSQISAWTLVLGSVSCASVMTPLATPATAQGWRGGDVCRGLSGRDRARCERRDDRRDRQRERRNDARTEGIVAGVIGTAILGGIIAAAASSGKKDRNDERHNYCEERYGNYDPRTDSYRASDGRAYPCS